MNRKSLKRVLRVDKAEKELPLFVTKYELRSFFRIRPRTFELSFFGSKDSALALICASRSLSFGFSALEVVRSIVVTVNLTLVTRTDSVFLLWGANRGVSHG